jgi:hypothetical protein
MGDVSRAKFYSDVLPELDSVHVGTRHLIVVSSMDRLIAKLLGKDSHTANIPQQKPRHTASPKSRSATNPSRTGI